MSKWGSTPENFHIGASSPSFVSNARRMLQVKAAKHYNNGYKSGKLATSRLYRVALPQIDGGDWNARVFKKRTQEADLLNTAITVLVDWSGSMACEKCHCAGKAAGLINDAFSRVLHVPLEVAAFSSNGEIPSIGVIKSFNETVTADEMALRFYDFLDYMSGNNDADVLLWAYNRILQRKEKRKVIIVLSDGSPADGIGDPYHALKTVSERILAEKRVDLYGIGIMDENVKAFYPRNRVIRRIEELEPSLVAVMSEVLT